MSINNTNTHAFTQCVPLIEQTLKANSLTLEILYSDILSYLPLLTASERDEICDLLITKSHSLHPIDDLHKAYEFQLNAACSYFNESYEKAIKFAFEAKNLFDALQEENAKWLPISILGAIYRSLGNIELALHYLFDGAEGLKNKKVFAHYRFANFFQIGSIYIELKQYSEAEQMFQELLRESTQINNQTWRINALQGLAKIYIALDKKAEAENQLNEALTLSKAQQNWMSVAISLTELGNIRFQENKWTESESLNREALDLRLHHQLPGGAITNYQNLSEICLKLKDTQKAIHLLEEALKISETIKVLPKQFQIHLLLSKVYETANNIAKSLWHYQRFHEIHEKVELEDTRKKINNVKLVFEAEQTKKENAIIKQQKAEIELKNIELQETIDELTRTKVGKKAKVLTLIIAIVLFVLEELILHFVLHLLPDDNFYLGFIVKMVIIFSLKPIDSAIEHYLLKRIIKKKQKV